MFMCKPRPVRTSYVFPFLFLLTISFVQSLHVQNIFQLHSPGSHHVDWFNYTSSQIDYHTCRHLSHVHEDKSHGNEHHGFQWYNDLIATRTQNTKGHTWFSTGCYVPAAFELFTDTTPFMFTGILLSLLTTEVISTKVIRGPPR